MTRTIYIESIRRQDDKDPNCYHYVPIYRNKELIIQLFEMHEITCERICQDSEKYWQLDIRGKRKNIRAFISDLTLYISDIYTIREY